MMVQEMEEYTSTRRKLRQIQKDLRALDLKRYLIIALEFNGFEKASISILRRWRGLTEARIAQVVNLLVELGHLVKLITFQSTENVSSVPLMFSDGQSQVTSAESTLVTGLIASLLYKDENVAIGEVPVTLALYNCGIRKPLIYVCISSIQPALVIGILGKPPLRKTVVNMVNIGILGYASVGKTSLFNLFRKIFEERGGNILGGQLGGAKKGNTHRHRITDYYRSFVIRNSDVFICMFDLSIDLEPQLTFYEQFELPVRSIVLVFNKFDLAEEPIVEHFIDQTEDFFVNKKKKLIFNRYITCAIPKSQYALYNENAVNSVLILCN